MASKQNWQFSKEKVKRNFGILTVSNFFHHQQPINKHFVPHREILEKLILPPVDLKSDFSDCDKVTLIIDLKEDKILWNKFKL